MLCVNMSAQNLPTPMKQWLRQSLCTFYNLGSQTCVSGKGRTMRIVFTAVSGVLVIIGTVIEAITQVLVIGTNTLLSHLFSLSLISLVHPLLNRLTASCRLNSRATSLVSVSLVILNASYI